MLLLSSGILEVEVLQIVGDLDHSIPGIKDLSPNTMPAINYFQTAASYLPRLEICQ